MLLLLISINGSINSTDYTEISYFFNNVCTTLFAEKTKLKTELQVTLPTSEWNLPGAESHKESENALSNRHSRISGPQCPARRLASESIKRRAICSINQLFHTHNSCNTVLQAGDDVAAGGSVRYSTRKRFSCVVLFVYTSKELGL